MSRPAAQPPTASPEAAFYRAAGDSEFEATELTRGPWDAGSQHAGPPAALLGRAIERCPGIGAGPEDRHVGRVTFEILAPVPIAALAIETEVIRGGRRVDLVEATLREPGGEAVVRARAWRLLRRSVALPGGVSSLSEGAPAHVVPRPSGAAGPPRPPAELPEHDAFFPTGHAVGYHSAMEARFDLGSFLEIGPATAWLRMRHPLLAGEEPTPLQRALIVADTGNGISSALDFERYVFINVELSVHLFRMPAGEWVCIDSLTTPEPDGAGLTDTLMLDERGPIGRAAQALFVAER